MGAQYDIELLLRQQLMVSLNEAGKRGDPIRPIWPKLAICGVSPSSTPVFQNDLLTMDHPGRQGFQLEVAVELFFLSNHHASLGWLGRGKVNA